MVANALLPEKLIQNAPISELTKIDTFYSEKLAEATRKLASLKAELVSLTEPQSQDTTFFGLRRRRASSSTKEKPVTTVKKLKDLKLAFSEYYLSLVLLQSYQNLNFTGTYFNSICSIVLYIPW